MHTVLFFSISFRRLTKSDRGSCNFKNKIKMAAEKSNRKKRMSCEEIMQLLEAYRKNECLWNYSNIFYKNKQKRIGALEWVREAIGAESVDEVKRRWKVIRDTYNIEKNKINASKKSGAGAADIYHTKLSWYKTANEFLAKCDARESYNNIVSIFPSQSKH